MVDLLNLAAQYWWLIVIFFVFGGGTIVAAFGEWFLEIIRAAFGGHRSKAKLKVENKALRAENERLARQVQAALEGKSTPITDSALVAENARMTHLLGQVQAADQALPQLPQPVRDNIDSILADRFL